MVEVKGMESFANNGLVPRPFDVRVEFEEPSRSAPVPSEEGAARIATSLRATARDLGFAEPLTPWQEREAYRVIWDKDGIQVDAVTPTGLRHGTAAAMQLQAPALGTRLTILDRPEFPWRGLSIDVARHFFGVDDICAIIDIAASLRLNVLHLHLSDDQGWRIEVPEFPELVERSSHTSVGMDGGGFFTTSDIRTIVDYAARNGLTVVPEIDVPGHVNAALHALPGLSPTGTSPDPYTGVEVGFSTLSTQAELTHEFLSAVSRTLMGVDVGPVHIGADECLATTRDEFDALVSQMASHVHSEGRSVVAWQEGASHLKMGDFVQLWDERQETEELAAAGRRGVKLIASPASRAYVDMKYSEEEALGTTWMGTVELRQSLEWDPRTIAPAGIEVAGVEACLFTETIRTFDDLTYMLLPRLAALAEVAWAGSGVGEWASFLPRVSHLAQLWQKEGIRYHCSPGMQ